MSDPKSGSNPDLNPELWAEPAPSDTKVDPHQERQLAGWGDSPLPDAFLFQSGADPDATPSPQEAQDDDALDLEEQRPHTATHKPTRKTLFAAIAVFSTVGLIFLLWHSFSARPPQQAEAEPEENVEEVPLIEDDSPVLRSQLAFQDQQARIAEETQPPDSELVVLDEAENPEPVTTPTPTPPPSPPPVRTPPPPARVSAPPSPATPAPTAVDPYERWAQLSHLGTPGQENAGATPTASANPEAFPTPGDSTPPPFQTVSIGGAQVQPKGQVETESESELETEDTPFPLSPGAQNLLDWQHAQTPQTPGPISVPLGTTVAATVTLPMAWDLDQAEQHPELGAGRFTLQLSQDLTTPSGSIVLPQGTTLIAQATAVNPNNQLIQASAIALVYPDALGRPQQQVLPPGALVIQGEAGQPLVAQRLNDVGPDLLAQDLLVGSLSALGQLGQVLNQPSEAFSSTATGTGTSTTVTRTTRAPNLLGGLLEGFGTAVSGRIERRSEANTQALIEANTIAILPQGTPVTVLVNSFFQVTP